MNIHFFTILQCEFLKLQPRKILGLLNFEADTLEKKDMGVTETETNQQYRNKAPSE